MNRFSKLFAMLLTMMLLLVACGGATPEPTPVPEPTEEPAPERTEEPAPEPTDALPALLPVGLGERGGEINQIFRNAFDRIVLEGEEIETVLNEEGDNLQTLMNETGAPCWAPDPASDGPCVVK